MLRIHSQVVKHVIPGLAPTDGLLERPGLELRLKVRLALVVLRKSEMTDYVTREHEKAVSFLISKVTCTLCQGSISH